MPSISVNEVAFALFCYSCCFARLSGGVVYESGGPALALLGRLYLLSRSEEPSPSGYLEEVPMVPGDSVLLDCGCCCC